MLEGDLFAKNKQYVRRQIIYCLLQVRGMVVLDNVGSGGLTKDTGR